MVNAPSSRYYITNDCETMFIEIKFLEVKTYAISLEQNITAGGFEIKGGADIFSSADYVRRFFKRLRFVYFCRLLNAGVKWGLLFYKYP